MKWREQLRILLWKNWTLKKRSMAVTLMEIFIPLILFVIMLVLRLQVPIEPKDAAFNEANPLPSAGFIPMLQTFCSNTSGSRSPDSFREQTGSVVDVTLSILTSMTDWLFPRQALSSKYPTRPVNNVLDVLMRDLHKDPWGYYKNTFAERDIDLVSLWEQHKHAIHSVLDGAEEEVAHYPRLIENLMNQVDHLSKLVAMRQKENPVPYSDDKKPLPEVCYKYVNLTKPPVNHQGWTVEEKFNGTSGNNSSSGNDTRNWLEEFEKIWMVTETLVCAEPSRSPVTDYMFGGSITGTIDDVPITNIILRTLSNNPKVLYGPTGTEADRIIENMLEPLDIMDDLTKLAHEWLRLSERIKEECNDTAESLNQEHSTQSPSTNSRTDVPVATPTTTHAPTTINTKMMSSTVHVSGTHPLSTNNPTAQEQATSNTQTSTQQTAPETDRATMPTNTRPHPTLPCHSSIIRAILSRLMNSLDWVTCRWLQMSGTDLNLKSLLKGFQTEEEIVDYFLNKARDEGVAVLSSIYFQVNEDGTLPEHMVYKIRQNATISQSTKLVKDLLYEPGPNWKANLYYLNGFIWLQDMADRAIINIYTKGQNNSVMEPGVYVEQVPTTCYKKDEISMVLIQHMMPLVMMLSWVFPVAILARGIVYEKELRLKEVMKLMGLERSVHWVGWWIMAFIQMVLTMTLLAGALTISGLMAYTNFVLLWLMLLTYGLNAIFFSFFVTVLFNNAKIAAACSGIFWMMTYVPYMFMATFENAGQTVPFTLRACMSFFSTTGLGMSGMYINFLESTGIGLQFYNVNSSMLSEDHYSVLVSIVMSLMSSVVYGVLTWYIDNVIPGDYGVPAPWYFPVSRTYWIGRPNPNAPEGAVSHLPACVQSGLVKLGYFTVSKVTEGTVQKIVQNTIQVSGEHKCFFEEEPSDLTPSVVIDKITKIYSNGTLAVNDLSLMLYEGQILAFLGHNGAGKTTTMSILTGMIPPTSGLATIYDKEIHQSMTEIRKSLGMCPQHNVLFESMTVEEHLRFYCRLKGKLQHSVDLEVESMLSDSGLREKRDTRVDCLSGGMKRKLSIGVAFISGSRTVILDEPTAGVDPWSRREIWDLILKFKHERTIMLSTHHMDEADILGDRIAIISHGQLKAVGSSLFMKATFGDGYHLIVAKKMLRAADQIGVAMPGVSVVEPESAAELQDSSTILTRCSEVKVTRAVKSHVASAYMRTETPRELHYILPFGEIKDGKCGPLFDYLDKSHHLLDIDSYGVTDTSLEEVFLNVTMNTKVNHGDGLLEAMNTDSMTGTFGQQYAPFAQVEQHGCRTSNSTIQSLPARRHRSRLGDEKWLEIYGQEAPQSFTVQENDGHVCTPSPIQGDQAPWVSSGRQRSGSEQSNGGLVEEKGYVNDAFVRSNSDDEEHRDPQEDGERQHGRRASTDSSDIIPPSERINEGAGSYQITGSQFLRYQFQTCMYKKVLMTAKNWKAVISQILLPVIFVSVAMLVGVIGGPKVGDEPALDLSTAQYYNISKGLGHHYVPYGTRNPSYNWSYDAMPWNLMKTFDLKSGVGATCVLEDSDWDTVKDKYGPMCDSIQGPHTNTWGRVGGMDRNKVNPYMDPHRRYYPSCHCYDDRRGMNCESGGYVKPPDQTVATSDITQNLTGDNMTEFLYYTSDIYRLSRFGAVEFGHDRPHVPYWTANLPLTLEHLHVRQAAKAMYDTKGWHSMPTYVNIINNAILRANLPRDRGNPAAYGISVINHPMKGTSGINAAESVIFGSELIVAMMVVTGFAFIPAGFVVFHVDERVSKAKHLQFVSGLSPLIYWVSNLLWDMLVYLLPAACCCIIFKVFGVKAFSSNENYPAVVVLVLLFGWSCTAVLYPASYLFMEASSAYVFLSVFNILIGVGCLFVTFLLDYLRTATLLHVSETLKSIFIVFPTFSLGRGLMDIVLTTTANDVNRLMGRPERFYPFDWKVTGRNNVALVSVSVACYLLTILIEYNFFIKSRVVPVSSMAPVDGEDPDVAAERERVLGDTGDKDMVRLENLTKIYRGGVGLGGKHLAVHRLCLGVPKGECFGMLGVNGAGKTTTFKMLTGDHPPTGGDAWIAGHSILGNMNNARRNLGYCPQFDALFDELTARQHLTIYTKYRGVPPTEVEAVVEWALEKLELTAYADIEAGSYSGGNKRKLSTAIALLGNPPVIFLDEPTAGMDPYAKHFLWDLILSLIAEGRCIIFTSHSMEECETLCTRLAIMVAGTFRCLGSVQHLKSHYGGGYGLKLTVSGPNLDANMRRVIQFLTLNMPLTTLKEYHHNMVEYEFSPTDYKLSYVFDKMRQALSSSLPVVEYSISQHTLDNVFIDFVKEQAGVSDVLPSSDEIELEEVVPTTTVNPLYSNMGWLNDLTPQQRKEKLEDVLVALTRRLEAEGNTIQDAETWNAILDILKGNDAATLSQALSPPPQTPPAAPPMTSTHTHSTTTGSTILRNRTSDEQQPSGKRSPTERMSTSGQMVVKAPVSNTEEIHDDRHETML